MCFSFYLFFLLIYFLSSCRISWRALHQCSRPWPVFACRVTLCWSAEFGETRGSQIPTANKEGKHVVGMRSTPLPQPALTCHHIHSCWAWTRPQSSHCPSVRHGVWEESSPPCLARRQATLLYLSCHSGSKLCAQPCLPQQLRSVLWQNIPAHFQIFSLFFLTRLFFSFLPYMCSAYRGSQDQYLWELSFLEARQVLLVTNSNF